MPVVLAVGAAFAYGIGVVLQYQAAQEVGGSAAAPAGGVRILLALVRRPGWLAGIAVNGAGFALRFFALRDGSLAVVQAIVLVGVVFAVPVDAVMARRRVPRRDVVLAGATVAGLVLFLSAARPDEGRGAASGPGWLALAAASAIAVLALMRLAAWRGGATRTLSLSLAGGLLVAFGVALCKQLADLVPHHLTRLPTDWQAYALVGVAAAGVVLIQRAYSIGPLSLALPMIVVVEPVVSVVVGVLLFHEHVRRTGAAPVLAAAGLVVLTGGAAALARSAAAWHEHHQPPLAVP
jgi:drug/metabolite transporter (DMT)-like permease